MPSFTTFNYIALTFFFDVSIIIYEFPSFLVLSIPIHHTGVGQQSVGFNNYELTAINTVCGTESFLTQGG